jgi:tRNA A-37 threonylcarbamoyl transferase component Bud32
MAGRLIDGRYLVESRIASGGMASVYRAVDRRLGREVALKVMHDNLALDKEFVSRFVREARAAARLSHSNVVQVFDQGSDGPVLYLAMEYLPGRTLRDVLTARGALTPRESVSVLEPVLGALAAAHRAGIVHGDVKPENVILTDDGRIKVADFGLARAISAPISVTASGELLGTVGYLAPELVSHGVADARADVYAAGIMLFELLTGKQPFTGTDPLQVAYRHIHETVPGPSSLYPELPTAFDDVVVQATSHDPDLRPPDAGALLSGLHTAVHRVPDERLDVRAADPVTMRLDPASTEVHPMTTAPAATASSASTAAPAATSQAQQTQVLAVSRRSARTAAPLLPRLKVHEDEPATGGPLGDPRRRVLAAIAAAAAVVLLIGSAIWWFSAGPGSYLKTPSLAGQRVSDARRILSAQGLLNQVRPAFDAKQAAGQVLSSDPAGGAKVKKNGTVVLIVSKGPELFAVPDVTGMTVNAATKAIRAAHLKVGATSRQFGSVELGKVISTSPKSKTKIAPGTPVDLVVSKGAGASIKGSESRLCVSMPKDVQNNETRATLDICDGGANQSWTATPAQQLTLAGSNKCLDVAGENTADGAAVQLYDCTGRSNQQWIISPDGTIVGVASGKCLDATDHGTAAGTTIQIWTCAGSPNQKWSRS